MHEFCRKRWWCAVVVLGTISWNASASPQAVVQPHVAVAKGGQQRVWASRWVGAAAAVAQQALRQPPAAQITSASSSPVDQPTIAARAKDVGQPSALADNTASTDPTIDQPDTAPPEPCTLLLHRMPGLTAAQCKAVGLTPSGATSHNGVPLYWRDVRPVQRLGRPIQPLRVMVVGAIHGDELTAATLAMRWTLMAEKDPHLVHWRFIPVLNPDGLLANPASRVNANGVDLNRNFPTPEWEKDARIYWEKRTRKDPRRWPGPSTLSEPESIFLHRQMQSFKPNLVLSLHAPYGLLDFDGPHEPPTRMGRLRLDRLGVFPGSLGHYGSVNEDMPVVTVELDHALDMPDDAEVQHMWRDLMRWIDTRLPQPREAPHIEIAKTTRELYKEWQTVWEPVGQHLDATWKRTLKEARMQSQKQSATPLPTPPQDKNPTKPDPAPAQPASSAATPKNTASDNRATAPPANAAAANHHGTTPEPERGLPTSKPATTQPTR